MIGLKRRRGRVVVAGFCVTASAFACGDPSPVEPGPDDAGSVVGDTGVSLDADAACESCQWFPEHCRVGAFCPVDVTLDARTVLLALGVHGSEVTAVGSVGAVIDYADGAWHPGNTGTHHALRAITVQGDDVWVSGSTDAVFIRSAAGDGGPAWAWHRPGGPMSIGHNRTLNGLLSGGGWVWAAITPTCAGGLFGDGVSLVRMRREPANISVEDVIRHDGFTSNCIGLNALDGTGGTIWTVGDRGVVYKLTDLDSATPTIATESSGATRSLYAVWAEAGGHVWAAGKRGAVLHRAPGGDFAPESVPDVAFYAIRGTSPSDVWIAGDEATVMHFDGVRWTRVPIAGLGDRRPTLRALAVTPDRVWVAGDGVLLALAVADTGAP